MRPCVRCGYCCRKAPCGYGEAGPDGGCVFLVPATYRGAPAFECSRYEAIKAMPGASFSPAFGAGCSSAMFNEDRERVLARMGDESLA